MNTTRSRAARTAVALFAVALLTPPAARAANIADFADYSLRNAGGQVLLPGRLFTPPEAASSTTPRPLMIFLHGGGAIGTNNTTQVLHTPDYMVDEAKRRGAYLYVPQTSIGWSTLSHIDSAMTMINRAVADLHADARRLHVAGYSNGGGGVWNIVSRNPGRFASAFTLAAVAPASGFNASSFLDTPVFAFHARNDPSVPVASSRNVVNSILTAAAQPRPTYLAASNPQEFMAANPNIPFHEQVLASAPPNVTTFRLTHPTLDLLYYEPPTGGHSDVGYIFYIAPLYDWMFDHTRAVPEPATAWLLVVSGVFLLRRRNGRLRCQQAGTLNSM